MKDPGSLALATVMLLVTLLAGTAYPFPLPPADDASLLMEAAT